MVVLTFLKTHWRGAVILLVVAVLALGGVRWCRKPTKLVEDTTRPAKEKIDRTTENLVRKLVADRDRDMAKLLAENARLRKAAESKVTVPFDSAVKGGTHAMAELATVWTAPGTAEQLRARWRAAADPADPGR